MKKALLLIGVLLYSTLAAEEPATPTFVYRVLQKSFRKEAQSMPEKVAADLKHLVPDDVKPWTVVSLQLSVAGYNYLNGDTPLEFCKRFDKQCYRFRIEIAAPGIPDPPDKRRWFKPEEIGEILDACPNCDGAETGETFWAFTGGDNSTMDQWIIDVLHTCAAHKRRFILGEGTWNKGHWTRFLFKHHDELRKDGLGEWLVAMHKNTKPWATFENVGALQGAWIAGLIGDYGIWNDPWVWTYSSFGHANEFPPYNKKDENEKKLPYSFFLRQWLWVISQGAQYSFAEDPMAFTREGTANSSFSKYLHPFIKGVGEHHITPSRAAVLKKIKAVVDPFGTYQTSKGPWSYNPQTVFFTYLDEPTAFSPKSYDPFTVLFRNTYGFSPEYNGTKAAGGMFPREPMLPDRLTREIQPNTARYFTIPILAHPDDVIPESMKRLKLADLRSDAAIKEAFDALYLPDPSAAYALEVDDSFFVINGNENRDADQPFKLPLGTGVLIAMQGDIPFQNIIFGKREGADRFWFQTNGYHGDGKTPGQRYVCTPKPTVITFTSRTAPTITAEAGMEARMTIVKSWDVQSQTVTLSFDHTEGAVNFSIRPKP